MIATAVLAAALGSTVPFVPDMIVTPTMVLDADEVVIFAGSTDTYPLVWALNQTGDEFGRKILLTAGTYPSFQFDSTAAQWQNRVRRIGSLPDAPVVIMGEDGAVIGAISDQWGSTIGVLGHGANHTFNYIHWKNIKFECSGDSAFLIGSSADLVNGGSYTGWLFDGCEIDGGYDWYTGTGRNSKWGILTWAVSDFSFRNGWVHDIKREHAFYMHNNLGDVWLEKNTVERCGRTFCQITARKFEFGVGPLPENPGDIHVRDNWITDVTLGDGCEGGQAITLTGRNRGVTWVVRNTILFGLDQDLARSLADQGVCVPEPDGSKPIGNGAVVAWTTGSEDYETSFAMVLIQNVVLYAEDAGRTSAMFLSALDILWASGNLIYMGLNRTAIRVGNGTASHPIPKSYVIKNNHFYNGDLVIDSLVADHCVSNNSILDSDLWLNGGPNDGGVITPQPFCGGAFCVYCR